MKKMFVELMLQLATLTLAYDSVGAVFKSEHEIFKPGPGLLRMQFEHDKFDKYSGDTADFPYCPVAIENMDDFRWVHGSNTNQQLNVQYKAYFVPSTSGNHRFFSTCQQNCFVRLRQEMYSTTITHQAENGLGWNNRTTSLDLYLRKGFRYLINVTHAGSGLATDFFQLGVRLPDGTEIKPITNRYLVRSIEFYNWEGLVMKRYNSISQSQDVENFILNNAGKYPNNPDEVVPCVSKFVDASSAGDYFALKYSGVFLPSTATNFVFHMDCDDLCRLKLGEHQLETSYSQSWKSLGPITFNYNQEEAVEIVFVEFSYKSFLQLNMKVNNNDKQFPAYTRTLGYGKTRSVFTHTVTRLSSTSLSVEVSRAVLPAADLWEYDSKCEIVYSKYYNGEKTTITLTGNLPLQTVITGLQKFTWYYVRTRYFGKLNKTLEYNVFANYIRERTAEDVPDVYPPNFNASAVSSTEIRCSWGVVTSTSSLNGNLAGYQLEYMSERQANNWSSVAVPNSDVDIVIQNLDKYTSYSFRLAAKTSKGRGPFSPSVTEKTLEDVPSGSPVNVTGRNESSTSIYVQWEEIIKLQRNGIITKYAVYSKKSNSSEAWLRNVVDAASMSYVVTGLKYWKFYDIMVAGATNVGEGTKSSIIKVRTDESTPEGGPENINATALTSKSINLTWNEIPRHKRNGIIVAYEIAYQRSDKRDVIQKITTDKKNLIIGGLDEYVFYDLSVAGLTRKGVGVHSPSVSERTLQDIPSGCPTLFKGNNISSTALRITWSTIPEDYRNGIIISYTIKYRLNGSSDIWQNTTVNSSVFSLDLQNMKTYRLYEFQLFGATFVGMGTNFSTTVVTTDVGAPTKEPMNLTGHFIDHLAINITWNCVPMGFRHAEILGYNIRYRDLTVVNAQWTNITVANTMNGTCEQHTNVSSLKIYTPYEFRISAFNFKGDGVINEGVTVWTDEYIPEQWPKNLTGETINSTAIALHWTHVEEIHGAANGKVLGYTLNYQVMDCYSDRPEGCDENEVLLTNTPDARLNLTLTPLRKYTNYSICVRVFNSKGASNCSDPIYIRTAEDEPDETPTKLETWPGKYHSIKVFWSPIPESLRNGIILGYRIFYKQLGVPMRRYDRAPRSVNSLAIFGALPGEKMKEVGGAVYETEIDGLVHFSWYQIRVAALTSKGLGVSVSINGTCKQGSPLEAPKLQVTDYYALYEITLKWNEISHSVARGEVLGYRITYWPIEMENEVVLDTAETRARAFVFAPNTSVVLKSLTVFTKYAITISAFTEGGFGVTSDIVYGETCRCPAKLKASWLAFPPLVNKNKPISGIFPKFVQDGIASCCGTCLGGQGRSTQLDWEDSLSSREYDRQGLQQLALSGTDIALPFFKDSSEVEGNRDSLHIYIPVVQSPGVAIFRRKPTLSDIGNEAADNLSQSVFQLVPYLAITLSMTAVAGIIFWFLERGANKEDFSDSFIRGSGSGFWFAFVTMTTTGYGDVAPKTMFGRIFAVGWTFCGLVLVSLLIGAITVFHNSMALTPKQKVKKPTDRTLASNNTFMISIMDLRRRTVIGDTSDIKSVREALLSGKITSVVYEAFEALHHKEALLHPMIELEAFKVVDASHGILLAGEARPVKSCLHNYFIENSLQILEEVGNYSIDFKIEKSTEEQLSTMILSSEAEITKKSVKYGLIVLGVCFVLGIIYDFCRWCRGRAKTTSAPSQLEIIYKELDKSIENLVDTLHERADALETQHARERIKLLNMDEKNILNIDPNLEIFDQTLRTNIPRESNPGWNYALNVPNDSEDSDGDQPITYRYSEVVYS